MSTMTATADHASRTTKVRGAGFFDRLIAAVHVSAALEANKRPDQRDLDILGIAEGIDNYLARVKAARG